MAIKRKTKSKRQKRKKSRNKSKRLQSMVECCVCRKNAELTKTLMPRKCLNKHGVSAHRICQKCWWDKTSGFALEEGDHACVGCVKGLPLNTNKNPGEIIDISSD